MKTTLLAALAVAALAAPALADRADDDLAAVRKAVGAAPVAEAQAEAAPSRSAEKAAAAPRRSSSGGPKWLRVRVVEKGQKHGRVSINLPLGLVRAFGEDWPVQGCRSCGDGHGPTLGEILRALDSGQSLVEIEDEDATVRVWVD
jgi:hypothetical protein